MVEITPTQEHWSELRGSDLCDLPKQTHHAAGPLIQYQLWKCTLEQHPSSCRRNSCAVFAFPSDQMHFSIFSSFHKCQQPEKQWRSSKYQISESSQNETFLKIFPMLWNSHTHTSPNTPGKIFVWDKRRNNNNASARYQLSQSSKLRSWFRLFWCTQNNLAMLKGQTTRARY